MVNFLENFIKRIELNKKKWALYAVIILLVLIGLVSFFDVAVAVGITFICFLMAITFFVLFKLGIRDKKLYAIFLIAFLIHLSAVLFIYFTGFKPFGGGADYEGYNQTAIQIAQRFGHLNFSLQGIPLIHYFPVLVGAVYAITLPQMIVGQLFVVWLAVISILLSYLVMVEIGASKKAAFLMSLAVSCYPSYLYFGSLLLKDTVVIPLILAGILLSVKMLKNFTALKFLLFFIVLTGAIHLRFYVGFALMFSFIICWFLISNFKFGERFIYGLTIIFILGFSPSLLNYGYYGSTPLLGYLNQRTITVYREVVYAPSSTNPIANNPLASPTVTSPAPTVVASPTVTSPAPTVVATQAQIEDGKGSSFVIKAGFDNPFTFVINYLESFICSLLGPFPWQLRFKRHLFFLLETIPWYFFFCAGVYGIYKFIRTNSFSQFLKRYKFTLPLFLFSAMALGALSLYINNYGIIVRIRMPMVIILLCIVALSFEKLNNIKIPFLKYLND